MFAYLIPVGVCCRDVGFEGVSFSFWCLVFLVLYLVSVYMVLGWVCSLHSVGYVEGFRVFGVFGGIAYVWELLGKFLHEVTWYMCIRVVISVCVVCCWRFLCEMVSLLSFCCFSY